MQDSSLKTLISGSYRKHLRFIYDLKRFFESESIVVLSPVGSGPINEGEEFILLDADPVRDHRILQDSIFAKLKQSSFLVLANCDDYIGKAALIEMGYAMSLGLNILTFNKIEDPNLKPYCREIREVFPAIDSFFAN